jgi:transglutaminase-like putative cysteine protease
MPVLLIRHLTTYRYRSPVAFGEHRMMLRPRESFDQHTLSARTTIKPEPTFQTWAEDPSGNLFGLARFGARARELRFEAEMAVDVQPFRAEFLQLADYARTCPFSYGAEEMPDLARFIERQHPDPERVLDSWTRFVLSEDPSRDTWAFLRRLNARIRRDFAYLRREEPGIQSPAHTLKTGRGSCRDFAVLMCEAVRALGMAARFVSGYLRVHDNDPQMRLAGGSTHAWLQVYLPGAGWIDFDPTSGTVGNADLVRVAVVRDPGQATPLSGSFLGFPSDFTEMNVAVSVALRDEPDPVAASEVGALETV